MNIRNNNKNLQVLHPNYMEEADGQPVPKGRENVQFLESPKIPSRPRRPPPSSFPGENVKLEGILTIARCAPLTVVMQT